MSNFSKFKGGDIVETTYGTVGAVMTTSKVGDSFDVRIKCTDGTQLTFDEKNLKFHNKPLKSKSVKFEDIGDDCPVCKIKFTVTNFGANKWKDCLPCGKKAEDLFNEEPDSGFTSPFEDLTGWDGTPF